MARSHRQPRATNLDYEPSHSKALVRKQPDVTRKLGQLLTKPEYQVAELRCDQGDNTYVLLNDRDLVVIYRDRDIAGIEELSRSTTAS